jgi:FixJ family two-component response regulator
MTLEELIIQSKTLKQIAKFLNCSERTVAFYQAIYKPTPLIGSPNDIEYENRLLSQESRGEWMHSSERHSIMGI